MNKITDNIFYIEGCDNPLSSDVAIIIDDDNKWLFDVGASQQIANQLAKESYNVVISHFHRDHCTNIDKINPDELFVSKETYRHLQCGTIVDKPEAKGNIRIFPLPSSHCKGSLALEAFEEYTFIGDSLYGSAKDDNVIYNSQLLQEEIKVIKNLKSKYIVNSHNMNEIMTKEEAISFLEEIYSHKEKNNPEIVLEK